MSPNKNQAPVKQGAGMRRLTKPAEVLDDDDIDRLIAAPPKPKSKIQQPKRKAIAASSDSSEVKVLESPSPLKKKIRAQPPSSISTVSPRTVAAALGALETHTDGPDPIHNFGRPKRVVKLTEKAQAGESNKRSTVMKPQRCDQGLAKTNAPDLISILPAAPTETLTLENPGSPQVLRGRGIQRVVSDDDDLPEVSNLFDSSSHHVPSRYIKKISHHLNNPFIDNEAAEDDDDESTPNNFDSLVEDDGEQSEQEDLGGDDAEDGASSGADVCNVKDEPQSPMSLAVSNDSATEESPEDSDAVMQNAIQNPILARSYGDLPHIKNYYAIVPYSSDYRSNGDDSCFYVEFSALAKAMKLQDVKNLVALLNGFTVYRQFVYIPRANPDLLIMDGRKLRLSSRIGPAMCLIPGVVTQSYLVDSLLIGRPGYEFAVHGLTIACLQQELRRESSVWGDKLKLERSFYGNIGPFRMSFVTLGEGKGFSQPQNTHRPPSSRLTPKKPASSFLISVKSPIAKKQTNYVFPSIRNFEDHIPIYDGTTQGGHPFTFSNADMDNLPNWPLFNNGQGEVPADAVVVVGYAASYYGQAETRYFAANIIFAIILSIPLSTNG